MIMGHTEERPEEALLDPSSEPASPSVGKSYRKRLAPPNRSNDGCD